jgi:hypothetical protein
MPVFEGATKRNGYSIGLAPVLGDRQVVALEQGRGLLVRHEVELVDEQDVRARALDDLGDVADLRVGAGLHIGDELALGVAVDRGVERGEAHGGQVAAGERGRRDGAREDERGGGADDGAPDRRTHEGGSFPTPDRGPEALRRRARP